MDLMVAEEKQKAFPCSVSIPSADMFLELPKESIVFYLQRLADAADEIKRMKKELEDELLRKMSEEKTKAFEFLGFIVKASHEKKTTVNAAQLKHMLLHGSQDEKEMAANCLSDGQSAWKAAEVQLMQDTIGQTHLVTTQWLDKVSVKMVDKKFIEGGK